LAECGGGDIALDSLYLGVTAAIASVRFDSGTALGTGFLRWGLLFFTARLDLANRQGVTAKLNVHSEH
jgi:hypothetical protein